MKKKIMAIGVLLASILNSHAQSCCAKKTSCNDMMIFASNKEFHEAHLAPEPIDYKSEKGAMITYDTPDGKTANAFAVLSEKKTNKVVFLFHEWWGLNDYVKKEAEALQMELGDVNVYALDLYDGKVATSPDSAGKYMMDLNPERASNIIKGLIQATEKNLIGKETEIATIGWCMGGSWSFQASLLGGTDVKACVMYYGFPEKDTEKIKMLKSDVLYIQALQDGFITKTDIEKFGANLKANGKKITIKQFDAVHAFANPSNPKFDKVASAEARTLSLSYIKKGLTLK